jgi:hypothetical protein
MSVESGATLPSLSSKNNALLSVCEYPVKRTFFLVKKYSNRVDSQALIT